MWYRCEEKEKVEYTVGGETDWRRGGGCWEERKEIIGCREGTGVRCEVEGVWGGVVREDRES